MSKKTKTKPLDNDKLLEALSKIDTDKLMSIWGKVLNKPRKK